METLKAVHDYSALFLGMQDLPLLVKRRFCHRNGQYFCNHHFIKGNPVLLLTLAWERAAPCAFCNAHCYRSRPGGRDRSVVACVTKCGGSYLFSSTNLSSLGVKSWMIAPEWSLPITLVYLHMWEGLKLLQIALYPPMYSLYNSPYIDEFWTFLYNNLETWIILNFANVFCIKLKINCKSLNVNRMSNYFLIKYKSKVICGL